MNYISKGVETERNTKAFTSHVQRLQLTLPTSFSFLLIFRMNKFKYIPRSSYTLQNLTPLCFGFQLPCCSLYGSSANEINCFSKFSQYKVFQKPVRTRGERQCSKWLRRSSATQHMPTSQTTHFLSSSPCISSPWGLGCLRASTVPLLRDFPQPGMPSTPHFGYRLSSASCFQCILPCQTIWNSAYFLLLNLVYFTSWYTQTVCMYLSICKCLIFIFKFQEKIIPVVSFFFFLILPCCTTVNVVCCKHNACCIFGPSQPRSCKRMKT